MYKVIIGIFEGTIFNGEVINNRVYNLNTKGQSYPVENCIKLKN
jgi:hypothetical protein